MFAKVKHILLVIFVLFTSVICILLFNNNNKDELVENTNIETSQTEEITRFNMHYNYPQMLKMLIEKNSDWSDLPLTEEFKKKYNSSDGILGKIKFDKVEMNPDFGGKYPFEDTAYFVITQGEKKTAYGYQYVFKNDKLLDDVLFPEKYYLTDEFGRELDFRVTINKENFYNKFGNLAIGGEYEQCIAVTEHFHKKYPYFLDLFIHYSPLGANPITFIEEKSSWEKKEAYFEVDSIYECIKRHYIVSFLIDSNGFLDDAEVKLIGEYPYEKDSLVKASSQVFYKNSNWNYLKLSDNFKNKYNESKTVYNDINELNIDEITFGLFYNDDVNVIINKYKTIDGSNRWLYEKYIYDENDYLDDVKILPIDYIGEDSEEAKEAYIKQYENNQ